MLVSYWPLATEHRKNNCARALLEPGGALFTYSYIISARQSVKTRVLGVSAHKTKFLQISILP